MLAGIPFREISITTPSEEEPNKEMIGKQFVHLSANCSIPNTPSPASPTLDTPLNVTGHLKPLTNVLWGIRPRWYHLGIQLNIDQPTLEVRKPVVTVVL